MPGPGHRMRFLGLGLRLGALNGSSGWVVAPPRASAMGRAA